MPPPAVVVEEEEPEPEPEAPAPPKLAAPPSTAAPEFAVPATEASYPVATACITVTVVARGNTPLLLPPLPPLPVVFAVKAPAAAAAVVVPSVRSRAGMVKGNTGNPPPLPPLLPPLLPPALAMVAAVGQVTLRMGLGMPSAPSMVMEDTAPATGSQFTTERSRKGIVMRKLAAAAPVLPDPLPSTATLFPPARRFTDRVRESMVCPGARSAWVAGGVTSEENWAWEAERGPVRVVAAEVEGLPLPALPPEEEVVEVVLLPSPAAGAAAAACSPRLLPPPSPGTMEVGATVPL